MRKPLVYVSGPSAELERCEEAMAFCRELGAEITYDWAAEIRRNAGVASPTDPEICRQAAVNDLVGASDADVLVFLDGQSTSPGRFVELGAAWTAGVPVVGSLNGARPLLWHTLLKRVCESDGEACAAAVALAFSLAAEKETGEEAVGLAEFVREHCSKS